MRLPEQPPAAQRGWRALLARYPGATAALIASTLLLFLLAGALTYTYWRYNREIARLREAMSQTERERADLLLAEERHRVRVALELLRRQALQDRELHLAVDVDSGRMYLEREGAVLREMDVVVGPERVLEGGSEPLHLAIPRGARTVAALIGERDSWEVPSWVYQDLGLPVPAERRVRGALGRLGIVLTGGTVIYSRPRTGPLSDSSYVLPGSILVEETDMRAIAPNVKPGMTVYFY
jgi:hypothetical protein